MIKRTIKRAALISLLVITGVISAGYILRNESDDFRLIKNLDIFYSLIRELNTFYVDGIDPEILIRTGIDEMLETLDPYTVYYAESDMDDLRFMTTGKYGGVGSLIRKEGDYAVLTQIYRDFPADRAGLKAGDLLLEIDGTSLKGLQVEQISDRLKGDPGTDLIIKVRRGNEDISAKLTRKRISIPPVPWFGMVDSEIGYIRFTNFTQDCSNDVRKALETLKEKHGATRVILDLRGNPGGLLPEAVKIVNLFVGPGHEVVSTRGKVNQYDGTYKTTSKAVDETIPLVVMINNNSASASEIVAGAIQDLDRGIIVGQRSYGKGLVQISRPLSYNTSLKVTTAKYYIPSGRCIQTLDFAHRNEDGSVGFIPDSLTSEFKTRNGRIVKDGGGILPDYSVESMRLSQVATELYLRSYIFDYATLFARRHDSVPLPGEFSLGEKEYSEFADYIKSRDFTYRSATSIALERLEGAARHEKYYETEKELFDSLRINLGQNIDKDLDLFREEIQKLLEDEIIGRYYYEEGVIIHTLKDDNQIKRALEILNDRSLYSSTLNGTSGSLTSSAGNGSRSVNRLNISTYGLSVSC
ncbi:MAG: S41 family peptidase [Bacteroidales bacterium]|nr:S41 family peptidase [Bacteroidales bacterium]